jgi:KaiC/GvpD/RAD55 family RecA-like ATPase
MAMSLEETQQRVLLTVGQMLVTRAVASDTHFRRICTDVEHWDGKQLLEAYQARHAKYGTTPFDPDGNLLRLYPGGLTVWSGYPGAGKTTLLRQLVCHCLARGSAVFLASLEEEPEDVLSHLAAVAAGRMEPSPHQMQWLIDAHGSRLKLWGRAGMTSADEVLAAIGGCAELGIKHAIVDSLMCLDVANDDFEAQRQFARKLAAVARVARIHAHLVAHPRKLVSAEQELDINDVAGAREIAGLADNVVFVRRKREGIPADASPMMVSIRKQRHGSGYLGDVQGYFQRKLRQFHLNEFAVEPTRYLPDDAYGA